MAAPLAKEPSHRRPGQRRPRLLPDRTGHAGAAMPGASSCSRNHPLIAGSRAGATACRIAALPTQSRSASTPPQLCLDARRPARATIEMSPNQSRATTNEADERDRPRHAAASAQNDDVFSSVGAAPAIRRDWAVFAGATTAPRLARCLGNSARRSLGAVITRTSIVAWMWRGACACTRLSTLSPSCSATSWGGPSRPYAVALFDLGPHLAASGFSGRQSCSQLARSRARVCADASYRAANSRGAMDHPLIAPSGHANRRNLLDGTHEDHLQDGLRASESRACRDLHALLVATFRSLPFDGSQCRIRRPPTRQELHTRVALD